MRFVCALSWVLLFALRQCHPAWTQGHPYELSSLAAPPALEAPGSFPRSSARGFGPELPCACCSLLQLGSYLQIYLFLICTAFNFPVPVHVMTGRIAFFLPQMPPVYAVYINVWAQSFLYPHLMQHHPRMHVCTSISQASMPGT